MANSLKSKLMASVANRISSLAFPSTASPIFEKLRDQQKALGIDPRAQFMAPAGFSEKLPLNTRDMSFLETRSEQARAKGLTLTGTYGPPKKGIASSPGRNNLEQRVGNHASHTHGTNGECEVSASDIGEEASGSIMKRKGANSKYVEDQRWPVTLKQLLGSKMLSQAQLKTASIENVRRMFQVSGGSATEREEVHYMFQRMLLEGFVRGVDLTKDIKKQGGTKVHITAGAVPGASNKNVIGMAKQGQVYLKGDFWRNSSDEAKLALFYHEMGHELLNRGHTGSGVMKSGGGRITAGKLQGTRQQYDAMMNELFRTNAPNQRSSKHLQIDKKKYDNGTYDPSWYPSATGDGSGYNPDYSGNDMPPPQPITNNYTTHIVPPSITPNVAAPTLSGIGGTGSGFNQPMALPTQQLPTITNTFSDQIQSMAGNNDGSQEQVGNILNVG